MLHKPLNFILLFILVFSTAFGQNPDINLLRDINLNRNQALDGTFKVVTQSAAPLSVGIPVGLLGAGLITKDSTMISNACVIGASVVTSTIVTTLLKKSINRPRPFVTYPDIRQLTSVGSESFPSGHTSGAFSLATSLSLEYPKWYIIVPSFAWASAVAYSRMDLGVHYPSDVLMGAVIGSGSAILCNYLNKKLFNKNKLLHHYCR